MSKKLSVSDILKELNIENTTYSPITKKGIDLTDYDMEKIDLDDDNFETVSEKLDENEDDLHNDDDFDNDINDNNDINGDNDNEEDSDDKNDNATENQNENLKHFINLKQTRRKKVDEFALTTNLFTHSRIFKKLEDTKAIKRPIPLKESEFSKETVELNDEIDNEIEHEPNPNTISNKSINPLNSNIEATSKDNDAILLKLNNNSNIKLITMTLLFLLSIPLFLFEVLTNGDIEFLGMPSNSMTFILSNTLILLATCVVHYDCMYNVIKSINKKIITTETLLLCIGVIQLLFYLVLAYKPDVIITKSFMFYTPITVLLFLLNSVGRKLNTSRIIRNYYTISEFEKAYTITDINNSFIVKNLQKGLHLNETKFLKNNPVKFLNKFWENSLSINFMDLLTTKYIWFYLASSFVVLVCSFIMSKSMLLSINYLLGFLILTYPVVTSITFNLPFFRASRSLNIEEGVIEGVEGVEKFKDVKSVTLKSLVLFPNETVVLNGIKIFSGKRLDEAILDIASVILKTNSVLTDLFLTIINHQEFLLKPVDNIVYEDEMGVSAWVDNRKVLIGNRQHMIMHNIVLPQSDFENQYTQNNQEIVYLCTSGVLTAVFIVTLNCDEGIKMLLHELRDNKIKSIIKSVDPMITKEKLSELFSIDQSGFTILPSRLHSEFASEFSKKQYGDGLICNNGSFISYAKSAITAKNLGKNINKSKVLFLGNYCLSFALFFGLLLSSNVFVLTVPLILIYNLFWLAIGVLISLQQ